ncbi:hypothetical protein Acr_18g0004560 [Actinidia rufa]|uniref:Retrotransposon Copia-like N-terminal domain-containing protein n=1 Tax=Actinidia rufa TaxID=165716 RepID=A0A7J0G679_9ERIC|nr:hypothetical protein Acr_18g0004560 [Actinidia rufa]
MADSLKEVAPAHMVPVPSPVPVSLSHSQPAQRVTSVLLNGKNFHAWPRSFQLYLGGKRKTRWILGKEPKPAESDPKFDEWVSDNCIILGWMFNSMEDRVYHMFMYHDTVHGLYGLHLTRCMPMPAMSPESLSSTERSLMLLRLPLDSLLLIILGAKASSFTVSFPTRVLSYCSDQRALAATSSGSHLYCQHCHKTGHLIDRCWVLHPELKQQFFQPHGGGRGGGRSGGRGRGAPKTGAIAEVEPIPAALPDFKQLQLQIAQLQSHLGLATASQSSGPTAAIVAETPTALHGPDFEEDFWQGMNSSIHPRPLPILEPPLSTPPPNVSLPPIASQDPSPALRLPCQYLLRSQVFLLL